MAAGDGGNPWLPPEPKQWWVRLIGLVGVLLVGWAIWNGLKLIFGALA